MSPASAFLLAVLTLAFLPTTIFLPATTEIVLGVVVRLRALRRPEMVALLTAPMWIEPLRTLMALALRNPFELTEAANLTAWSALTRSRWFMPAPPMTTFWPVRRTPSSALMRPRIRMLPSGEIGNEPFIRLLTAPLLIAPFAPIMLSVNSFDGVETFRLPTLTVPLLPTTKP